MWQSDVESAASEHDQADEVGDVVEAVGHADGDLDPVVERLEPRVRTARVNRRRAPPPGADATTTPHMGQSTRGIMAAGPTLQQPRSRCRQRPNGGSEIRPKKMYLAAKELGVTISDLTDDTYYRQDEDFISRIKPENKKTPADNRPEPSELCPRRDSNPGHAD